MLIFTLLYAAYYHKASADKLSFFPIQVVELVMIL